MNNIGQQDDKATGIKGLLDRYLASREEWKSSVGETSFHLDEDSLAAFTEGNLSQREAVPLMRHLVDCGFCRHKTAELVMLDLQISGSDMPAIPASTTEPSAISRVLNGVLAKIFGTTDQAVFAHTEDEDGPAEATGSEEKKDE